MESLNPFGTGQCLSTKVEDQLLAIDEVSIPLEQGNVFRLDTAEYATDAEVSIPLEQGNVFRRCNKRKIWLLDRSQSLWNRAMSFDNDLNGEIGQSSSLNPFGTGQCLSTLN